MSNSPRIAFQTHGCKLNQAETEALARTFAAAGYRVVGAEAAADVYLLNSCSVTHIADAKARQWLRRAGREHPGSLVVATGCYATRDAATLRAIPGVRVIAAKDEIVAQVTRELGAAPAADVIDNAAPETNRYRAMVKIQDGCQSYCTYCVVPLVRAVEMSRPADEIIAEIKNLLKAGFIEIVLTGTKVGTYRDGETDLTMLLKRILDETNVTRLRLSSLQPQEISAELIDSWREPRLCRHFHLSLQSGSDSVLQRMNRRYRVARYRDAVDLIRARVPDVAITTDVIAGFPGETDAEFAESYEFCREIGFARLHVFPYSPRSGTAAAGMPQVPSEIKRQRNQELLALARESLHAFNAGFSGRVIAVLWEQQAHGVWSGLTDNYIRVFTRRETPLGGCLTPVVLGQRYQDGLWGEISE